jgi:putative polyketide hydroxylase
MWLSRSGARISTLDLYERSLVLLSSAGGGGAWHTAAKGVAERLSVPLDSYRIGNGPDAELSPASDMDWAEVHGVTEDGAVLIRPDGFVAWRSAGPSANPETALREALAAILDRG